MGLPATALPQSFAIYSDNNCFGDAKALTEGCFPKLRRVDLCWGMLAEKKNRFLQPQFPLKMETQVLCSVDTTLTDLGIRGYKFRFNCRILTVVQKKWPGLPIKWFLSLETKKCIFYWWRINKFFLLKRKVLEKVHHLLIVEKLLKNDKYVNDYNRGFYTLRSFQPLGHMHRCLIPDSERVWFLILPSFYQLDLQTFLPHA